MAAEMGLFAHHCMDSRRCLHTSPGLPDLIIVGENGVLFRELKSDDGATTADQDGWGYALYKSGANVGVWRPRHLLDQTIYTEMAEVK